MNILVISDLHIDNGDSFGTFQWNQNDLIVQIERIRKRYKADRVILNGDVFELLKYSYNDIKNRNPVLLNYFKKNNFILLRGNHDIFNPAGLHYYQITNSYGQVIHIEHGHLADWFNGSRIGYIIGKAGFSILKKLRHSRRTMEIYLRLVALDDQINHIPKKYNRIKYLTYALRLLKEYDVVILGHTHKLESHHTYYLNKKKRYLNCGSCSMGRFQGIILDTETLKYEMIKESKASLMESLKKKKPEYLEFNSLSA